MIDLDALQRHLDANGSLDDGPEYQTVGDLVAEARAARDVIRLGPRPPLFIVDTVAYAAALDAYDRVVTQ
jgi:hypothetical protein